MRARYYDGNDRHTGSGPWSDPPVEVTAASSASPPGQPSITSSAASHDHVLLSWDAPDGDGISGYQVLRGPDADNLAVLVDDTGSTATSYSDDSVAAKTTYTYAVRAQLSRPRSAVRRRHRHDPGGAGKGQLGCTQADRRGGLHPGRPEPGYHRLMQR